MGFKKPGKQYFSVSRRLPVDMDIYAHIYMLSGTNVIWYSGLHEEQSFSQSEKTGPVIINSP